MRNTLKIDRKNNLIVMDRTFAKLSANTFSEEYRHLQQVRQENPTYMVVQKRIKRNKDKETWKGLTYDYMREYIVRHEETDTRKVVMEEFEELIIISKCHAQSKRYPVIKNWFLNKYPEIKKFGMPKEETAEVVEKEACYEVVAPALEPAA